MQTSKLNKENCQKAYQLRLEGCTYREVGRELNVSEAYARQMTQLHTIMQARKPLWTAGLSSRVSNAIRLAGFTSREDVMLAFQNAPEKLQGCVGLGDCGMRELRDWADVAD